MSTYHLESFLRPASVVLVGASRQPGSVGAVAAGNLRHFPGRVFRVNHRLTPDAGAGIYPTVDVLPGAPQLAIVAIPAAGVPAVITDLGRLGVHAAVVLSAGFAESAMGAAGEALQAQMLAAARPTGLRIVGPNCIGVLSPRAGLNAGFAQALPRPGGLAFLSQSGAVLTTLIDWAAERDIGFSALVSLGEMAEVDVADWLDYFATDPQTSAVLLYLESASRARKFLSAARHAARVKPVIVLKSGRTQVAAEAAASHVGGRAGGDAVFDAALRRSGAQRVPTLLQMLEAAETLAHAQPMYGEALAIVTNGGGVGVLAADQLLASGGCLAELGQRAIAALDGVLPANWSHANPVDLLGDAGPDRYRAALAMLLDADEIDAVAVMYCPNGLADPVSAAQSALTEIESRSRHKPVVTAWLGPPANAVAQQMFATADIPHFDTPEALVRGYMQLVDRRRRRAELSQTVAAFPLRGDNDRVAVRRLIDAKLRTGGSWLDEVDAKHLLALAGVEVNETRRAHTPSEAKVAARALSGPYAVKILSPDVVRKSDVGGVALNVETPGEVERVAECMIARLHATYPKARLTGVAVQTMVQRANAQELIAGITLDPVFGPAIVFGAGGVAADAIDDTALTLPPLNINLARELTERTRIYRVLAGAGGRLPQVDLDALHGLLIRLSELVCEFADIAELTLNPVQASPAGVVVLGARVRLQRAHGRAVDRLAIVPYPRELERPFTLPDGTRCTLRPIRAEDEIPLREAFQKLSPEHRYMRLFHALNELPHELAARATQIDYDREMTFVLAEDKPAGEAALFGDVSLFADANRESGEFAITVIDTQAGHGVGRHLMELMIDYARRIGLREIVGDILVSNTTMLRLARNVGFRLMPEGDGVVRASLVLT